MISVIKIFGFALTIGSAFAGAQHDHHHHQHQLLGYRGYAPVSVFAAGPAVVAKGVPAYYAHGLEGHHHGHHALHGHHGHGHHFGHAHAHAPVAYLAGGFGGVPAAYAYAAPNAEHVALLSAAGKPKLYSKSVPAAAVRNVETVMVTKTITPVVTKTVTHHTHAEPALSLGHVQGYKQGAVGHAKIAPVQFNTAYTTYANPTVGVNGPVVYSGPAVGYEKAAIVAEPVKSVQPVAYKTAALASPYGAYAVYPGSALSLAAYGYDPHSVPVANFIDLRSGKQVYAPQGHVHGHHAHTVGHAHGHAHTLGHAHGHAHGHSHHTLGHAHAHLRHADTHGHVHSNGHRHTEHAFLHKK